MALGGALLSAFPVGVALRVLLGRDREATRGEHDPARTPRRGPGGLAFLGLEEPLVIPRDAIRGAKVVESSFVPGPPGIAELELDVGGRKPLRQEAAAATVALAERLSGQEHQRDASAWNTASGA
jgi:hypothetical protein